MKVTFYYCNTLAGFKTVGNALLKIGQGTSFGHFAIGLETVTGEYIYEAVFPRYKKSKKEEWLTHYSIDHSIQWTVPQHLELQVFEWLESWVGVRYALEQILLIAITIFSKPLDYLLNTAIINSSRALVCTEVGSRFAEKFFGFLPTKSHDKIGLLDVEFIGLRYEHTVKWSLQT